jgi:hypothetical protein
MWRRFVATPVGWVLLTLLAVSFAVVLNAANTSTMSRNVALRGGGLFSLLGVGIRVSLGRRLLEADGDEAEKRAAVFVLTVPMLAFGLALAAAGLTSLLLHL